MTQADETAALYARLVDACERHSIPHNRVGKLAGCYRGVMREMAAGSPVLPRTREKLEAFIRALDGGTVPDKLGVVWSEADLARLRVLWNSGVRDDRVLAHTFGRSPRAIRMCRCKQRLLFSAQEVAKKRASIIQGVKPTRDWPSRDDLRLAIMLRDRVPHKTIADTLGRTESAVWHRRQVVKPAAPGVRMPNSNYDGETGFQAENNARRAAVMATKQLGAALAKVAIPPQRVPRKRTFEELLAAVEAGEVRVTERIVMRAPEYHRTMGGVVGDYSI